MGAAAPALSANSRYMGGKSLLKFFREDTWPALADLFERLGMNESKGFEIFKAFAKTDVNEDGLVDIEECFKFLGGKRTKFTERILYSEPFEDEDGNMQSGLTFKQFIISLWSYCTLTPLGVARYIFEIFDVDENEMLEKPDIISMFKMLYHTDEHEEDYISIYKFDQYVKISKDNFCSISAKEPYLIQPALDYQKRLRSRVGGRGMWLSLTAYREYELHNIEEQERNLSDSISAVVVASKGYSKRYHEPSADLKIQSSMKKIATDAEMAERELKLQQRRQESESRSQRASAPDRKMHQAWSILHAQKRAFEAEEYLTTDLERRCKDRNKLFALFDVAKKESIAYYEYKDAKDMEIAEGSEADHEARFEDHRQTEEGRAMLEIVTLLRLFELVLEDIEAQVAKMKRKPKKKSEKQLIFESQRNELQKILTNLHDPAISDGDRKKRMRHLIERDFTEEHAFVKKNCKKAEITRAEEVAHKELCAQLKEKTLADMREQIAKAQEERRRDYIVKEFDIVTNFGSRNTRWEYVLNKDTNKLCYMARDTLEMKHPKSAICEKCDSIFVQHELRCDGCNGPRSAKNLKLYRPLGFKDITLE